MTHIYPQALTGTVVSAHGLPQGYMLSAEELRVVCTSVEFLTDLGKALGLTGEVLPPRPPLFQRLCLWEVPYLFCSHANILCACM